MSTCAHTYTGTVQASRPHTRAQTPQLPQGVAHNTVSMNQSPLWITLLVDLGQHLNTNAGTPSVRATVVTLRQEMEPASTAWTRHLQGKQRLQTCSQTAQPCTQAHDKGALLPGSQHGEQDTLTLVPGLTHGDTSCQRGRRHPTHG